MSKFTGNIIRLPAVTPTQNSASGVYTLDDQFTAQSSGTWPIVRDQYFNYTTLLLTGAVQGTAYPNPVTQPYSFLSDASTNNFVVSPNGDVSARPFNPYLNNYSNSFNGTSDYLSIADNAAFNFGTGDATVEFWFNSPGTTNNYPGIVSAVNYAATGVASIRFDNTGYKGKVFMYLNGGGDPVIASTSIVPYNTWTHVAIVRQGTSLKLYLNGSLDASVTISASLGWYLSNGGMRIGRGFDVDGAGGYYPGYLTNLRLVKGTAVYTAPFVSSTIPLQNITNTSLLTCQSNRFRDNGTANSGSGFTITPNGSPAVSQNSPFVSYDTTNGSGYFDGTGDQLTVANNSAFDFGSGDFTVEAWCYFTGSTGSVINYSNGQSQNSNFAWEIYQISATSISMAIFQSTTGYSASSTALVANAWNHVAGVRSGNTLTVYVNGVAGGTTANVTGVTANNPASATVKISGYNNATSLITGYVSNARIVKGTAVYTAAFTPPTAPLQAVTNTSLLTLQTRAPATNNGFIDSSPNNFVVTRNGNATQGSFSPFSPTGWSNYFNGSASLQTASSSSLTFGTGDFSISFWIYPTVSTAGTNTGVMGIGAAVNGTLLIYTKFPGFSDNTITIPVYGGGSVGSSIPLNVNQWNHVAISRASGTLSIYINGTRGANSPLTDNLTGSIASIGKPYYSLSVESYTGYLADVRFVKGTALYSGTSITVPTSPSTLVAGTALLTSQYNRFYDGSGITSSFTIAGSPSVQAFSPFAPAQSYIPSQIGGSGYFDGTGDYVSVTNSAAYRIESSSTWTWECFVYPTSLSSNVLSTNTTNGSSTGHSIYLASGLLRIIQYGVNNFPSTATVKVNEWSHLAVVCNANAITFYLNGTASGTATWGSGSAGGALFIGASYLNTDLFTGYMCSMRYVVGTAIVPPAGGPTAPLTAIPNTSLLLNFTNGGIVDATGKNNLETVGNSSVQTSQAKWSPGSMYFDGGGDWLVVPKTGNWSIGSSEPFTIEAWVYLTAAQANYRAILSDYNSGTPGSSKYLFINSSGIEFQLGTTAGTIASCTQSFSQNQWYYIAITRNSSNVISMYVDGTSKTVSQATQSGGFLDVGSFFYVGRWGGATAYEWYGYIDDLRITKGIARTITASPTGPFPLG